MGWGGGGERSEGGEQAWPKTWAVTPTFKNENASARREQAASCLHRNPKPHLTRHNHHLAACPEWAESGPRNPRRDTWRLAEISIYRASFRPVAARANVTQMSRETGGTSLSWIASKHSPVCSTAPSAYLFLGIRELDEQPLSEVSARECQANNVLELPPLELSGFYLR